MGLFKQMKDMKKMVEAAPGMVAQAQDLGAQAQQYAAAQQAAASQTMAQVGGAAATATATAPVTEAELEPINGVSLELYVEISKGLAAYGYDQSKAVEVAASKGVSPDDWQQAMDGWNARITANRAVGARFNQLYRAG